MRKPKRAVNDVRMQRLELAVKRILATQKEYERDYNAFWEKENADSLTASELTSAAFLFRRKWSLPPQPIEMINAIFKRGEASNWEYESCSYLVTRTYVFLDEKIEMDVDGKPLFFYAPDKCGRACFWIDIGPNTPRELIHRELDEELDRLHRGIKTEQPKPRHRSEKLGGLVIRDKVKKGLPLEQAARELTINKDTAKKRYKVACQSDKIDKHAEPKKPLVKGPCPACEKYPCSKICPAADRYANQDARYQREFTAGIGDLSPLRKTRKHKPAE